MIVSQQLRPNRPASLLSSDDDRMDNRGINRGSPNHGLVRKHSVRYYPTTPSRSSSVDHSTTTTVAAATTTSPASNDGGGCSTPTHARGKVSRGGGTDQTTTQQQPQRSNLLSPIKATITACRLDAIWKSPIKRRSNHHNNNRRGQPRNTATITDHIRNARGRPSCESMGPPLLKNNIKASSVRFAPDSEILYIPVPALADVLPKDAATLWWSAEEFMVRREEYTAVIELMEKQHKSTPSDKQRRGSYECIEGSRGLEHRTEEGAWLHYTMKRRAYDAVFHAQAEHRKNRVPATTLAVMIALAYTRAITSAVQDALERGTKDATEAKAVAQDCSSSTTPTDAPSDLSVTRRVARRNDAVAPKTPTRQKIGTISSSNAQLPPSSKLSTPTGCSTKSKPSPKTPSKRDETIVASSLPVQPVMPTDIYIAPMAKLHSEKSLLTLDASGHSHSSSSKAASENSRPRLRREAPSSSRRNLMKRDEEDLSCSDLYSVDAAQVAHNRSQGSLNSGGSCHNHPAAASSSTSLTASRPRLRRETVASQRSLLDCGSLHGKNNHSNHSKRGAVPPAVIYAIDNDDDNDEDDDDADEFHTTSNEVTETMVTELLTASQRSLFSISSQISASSTRPRLLRQPSVSSKRRLLPTDIRSQPADHKSTKKSHRVAAGEPPPITTVNVGETGAGMSTSDPSQSPDRFSINASQLSLLSGPSQNSSSSSLLSRPDNRREEQVSTHHKTPTSRKDVVLPPRQFMLSSSNQVSKDPILPVRASREKRDKKLTTEESTNSLESPLSTSASSESTSSRRPGLRREASIRVPAHQKLPRTPTRKQSQRKLKGIRFNEGVTVLPQAKFEAQFADVWISSLDLAEITERSSDVVIWMEQGIPVISETSRGLEHFTATAAQELSERRQCAVKAVLAAQEEERRKVKNGCPSSAEYIATQYRAATKESRVAALDKAKLDAMEVL